MTAAAPSPLSPASKALLLAAGVWVLASPAAAQPAPAEAARSVTPLAPVAVQAAPPAVINKEARSFVQAYTMRSGKIDQIPRWHQPICVQVSGLVPNDAAKVAARIEAVAKAVGLKIMKPGCQSNIQVVFTDKPQSMADTIGEAYVGFHYAADSKKVRTVTHPIQGWYATATTGSGDTAGMLFAGGGSSAGSTAKGPDSGSTASSWQSNFGQSPGAQLSPSVVDSPEHSTPTGCADSRFSSCMQSSFANVLLIADSHAIEGKDLGAVTDYLAMLALAQPKSMDGCNALPSVIDLMAKSACPDRDPPAGLTAADSAYLTALYASDAEARTNSAESDIADHMARILIKAQAVAR